MTIKLKQPKLSLILPMYNVENYIEECLDSIYSQSEAKEVEVILINDGSPDNSAQVAERWLKTHTHLHNWRILHQENKKQGAARNYGVSVALGEYIWFIDTDDWIAKNSLGKLIRIIESEHPEAIAFNTLKKSPNGSLTPHYNLTHSFAKTNGVEHLAKNIGYCSSPWNIVIAYDFLKNNGLRFIEFIFHEDTELMNRVYFKLKQLIILPDSLYIVRINPSSTTRSVNPKRAFDLLTVSQSLDNFYKANNKEHCANIFHNIIAMCLNSALSQAILLPHAEEVLFRSKLRQSSYLFSHFCKSKSLKYRIEGLMFTLFAFNRYWCYKAILRRLYK